MGGVGKSELALQYALQSSQEQKYKGGICWLNARSSDLGTQIVSFARTYLNLQIPEGLELPNQVAYCWRNWQTGDVLVVLDDVTKYKEVEPFLPPTDPRFKVLMTTRLQLGKPIKRLDLQVLTLEAALNMLRSYIGDERVDSQLNVAEKLCEWLGKLPLGLELVGRYLERKADLSLEEMLARLEAKRLKQPALNKLDATMTAQLGVRDAFELSWQELDEPAKQLGLCLSLFALAPIPWQLVELCLPDIDSEELEEIRDDGLVKLNLVMRKGKNTYQLHELIREFFQDKQKESAEADELQQAFAQVMVEIAQTIPEALTLEHIAKVQDAIPHLEEVAKNLMLMSQPEDLVWLKLDDIGWSFTGLGQFYMGQGLYAQAEPVYLQALELFQRLLGDNHLSVANTLNNLAELYRSQGRYSEAEPVYLQALELGQRNLGENHSLVATSLNNLAELYRSQGRYSEAEPLYLQALLYKCLLGEDHPHVATSLNNLALLYYSQGRYDEAEPLFLQALELYKCLLGEDHPDVATSLNNLALLYYSQGRYDEAEPLFLQALELRKRLLGEDHPDVAQSLNNLAGLYYYQGRYTAVEPLLEQALELNKRLLGEDHPDVALSLNNLANLYDCQGRYTEAEPLYLQALEIAERRLGTNHPHTVIFRKNLQSLRDQQVD